MECAPPHLGLGLKEEHPHDLIFFQAFKTRPLPSSLPFNALFRETGCFFVVCFGGDLDQRVIVKRRNMEIPLEMERPRTKEQLQGRNKLITWLSLKLELGWAMGPLRMPETRGEC